MCRGGDHKLLAITYGRLCRHSPRIFTRILGIKAESIIDGNLPERRREEQKRTSLVYKQCSRGIIQNTHV